MEGHDSGIMRKETVLKEDGRYLIYYTFETPGVELPEESKAEAR